MAKASSAIPFAGIPFPRSEYEHRQKRVLEAMARADLDALLVTAHGHLRYLTGYDGLGGYFMPFPLILVPRQAPTYVVREYEVNGVRAESCIDEVVGYIQQQDFAKVCADVLRRYGLENGRVGFELGCWNLAPADVGALQAQLPNLKVVDATRLVTSVSVVKSELEIKIMREAMAMTDLAMRTFQGALRDGVTEAEVAASIHYEIRNAGGDDVRMVSLGFGERNKLPHGKPTRHPLRTNEPAMIEVGGTKHGYAAGLVRSAVLGRHPEAESLHALSEEALEAAIAAIKPGVTAGEVDAAGRKVIERSRRPEVFRHRTGYQIGLNWGERGNLSLEPGAVDILQSGMTLHMPFILFSESGYLFGCSENVLVTERGAEILSQTPHTLYRA
ncbi:Xaa-Pro peptidase family protein [Bradyrhizobium sp. 33ap4]|uniref:M24 family metallopeptidase n=1 Tax=Bradyrhizobium sp. 33ap4 TaxID=3061630 RepID=UPI00292CDFBC|nr:Xaa-Pro peptidase family protein [Bradyrhizobium sp. 33ap4]